MASPTRVLLVDDEPNVLITIQAILEQDGYRATAASSIADARGLVGRETFDVALLDLRIDNGDGIDFLGELRAYQPECVPIMLTGYASMESAIRAIRHGAYDYLMKPCSLDELKLTVARAAERNALTRSLRERLDELNAANVKLQSFSEELQRRVDAATEALSRKVGELDDANRRLEEEQRQREAFISMIAHELRGPLTTISGYAQLLNRANLPPNAQRASQTILAETGRLGRLVQDQADASLLAAGQFTLVPEPFDLVEAVREQAERARIGAEAHTLRLELPGEPIGVVHDRDRVAQVLSNLIANALKYTPGGEIRVALERDADLVRLSVEDQGPGIPADRLEAIFEPHVRLNNPSGSAKGAGLGLYIARGIVEAHGGRIWAESGGRGGATFRVALPPEVRPAGEHEALRATAGARAES